MYDKEERVHGGVHVAEFLYLTRSKLILAWSRLCKGKDLYCTT